MSRTTSSNYSSPSFPIANADSDPFDANDIQQLAAAVNGHDHSSGKGLTVSGGGGSSLTSSSAFLSADVNMTSSSTWYDGPSLTLAAGTWLVMASLSVTTSTVGAYTMRLWNGASTTYVSTAFGLQTSSGYAGPVAIAIITLASSTTVKASAYANAVSSTKILAAAVYGATGNNASWIHAVKIG